MRKVHKLDIKEEVIAVEHNLRYLELIERSNKLPHNKILYKIFEMNDPQFREPIYYGIKQDDLFNHILQISNDELERIKSEHYDKGRHHGHTDGYADGYNSGKKLERYNIKNLSWWKRLLKKF